MAVNGHNLEIMKLLIEHGADVNEKDNSNTTIIMNAVNENFVEGVKLLLEHNADISPVDDLNQTVFTIAEEFDEKEIIDLLNSYKNTIWDDNSVDLHNSASEIVEEVRTISVVPESEKVLGTSSEESYPPKNLQN